MNHIINRFKQANNINTAKDFDETTSKVIFKIDGKLQTKINFTLDLEQVNVNENSMQRVVLLGTQSFNNVYIINLGAKEQINFEAINNVVKRSFSNIVEAVQIDASCFSDKQIKKHIFDLMQTYFEEKFVPTKVNAYDKQAIPTLPNITLVCDSELTDIINEGFNLAKVQNIARELITMPGNILTPDKYVNIVEALIVLLANKQVSCDIKRREQIIANGYQLLAAVNKGSEQEAALITLEYCANSSDTNFKTIVGKGITYDSGGYSLKQTPGQIGMKADMGGSAVALATFISAVLNQGTTNLRVILAITDNKINEKAFNVDDVITTKHDISVEIKSTDAEGRLVLADGVLHAQEFETDEIISVATLTLATMLTDANIVPFFCNSKQLTKSLSKAARKANENIWPMPLDHFNAINYNKVLSSSKVATIASKNPSSKAPSLYGANFIYYFVLDKAKTSFSHFDIGGNELSNGVGLSPTVKTLAQMYAK